MRCFFFFSRFVFWQKWTLIAKAAVHFRYCVNHLPFLSALFYTSLFISVLQNLVNMFPRWWTVTFTLILKNKMCEPNWSHFNVSKSLEIGGFSIFSHWMKDQNDQKDQKTLLDKILSTFPRCIDVVPERQTHRRWSK